jgi:hypothetical protein
MLRFATRAILLSMLAALLPAVAQAESAEFCSNYAQTAVQQVQAALAVSKCAAGIVDPDRWTAVYNAHFNWCLRQAAAQANSQTLARTEYLRACGG